MKISKIMYVPVIYKLRHTVRWKVWHTWKCRGVEESKSEAGNIVRLRFKQYPSQHLLSHVQARDLRQSIRHLCASGTSRWKTWLPHRAVRSLWCNSRAKNINYYHHYYYYCQVGCFCINMEIWKNKGRWGIYIYPIIYRCSYIKIPLLENI